MNKLVALGVLATAAAVGGRRRFRRDMDAARQRLSHVPRATVETSLGAVEYADVGAGQPILVVHGIFGGRDQGLDSFDGLVPGRRVLAPSRFGYLGSSLPPGATPARQADAFAELLDALGIDRVDVIAYSAGSTSALQFALRHPDRARALVVMCGDWPGATAAAPPPVMKVAFRSDAIMWLATTLAGPALLRFVAGVPRSFAMSDADRANAQRMTDSLFPVGERSDGIIFDAYTGNLDVNDDPLEAIDVPTLVVHACDDTMAPFDAAAAAVARIPGARLLAVPSGGHLLLGHETAIAAEVASFLDARRQVRSRTRG